MEQKQLTKIKLNEINGIPGDSFDYCENKFELYYSQKDIIKFIPIVLIIDFVFVSILHIYPQASLLFLFWSIIKPIIGIDWLDSKKEAQLSFLRRKKAISDFSTKSNDELKEIYDFNSNNGTDKKIYNKINTKTFLNYIINFIVYAIITWGFCSISFFTGFIFSIILFYIFCNCL